MGKVAPASRARTPFEITSWTAQLSAIRSRALDMAKASP